MEAEPKRAYGEAVGQEPGAHSASTLQKNGGEVQGQAPRRAAMLADPSHPHALPAAV